MVRLLIVLGSCYAASLVALLPLGVRPGLPWQILVGFVCQLIPSAVVLAWLLTRLEDRIAPPELGGAWGPRQSFLSVAGIAAGLAYVWFFQWTDPIPVRIGIGAVAVWLFVVGSAKPLIKPLALSILALLLGFGAVWNVNYLAGLLLPAESLRDQTLLDFDVAFYRAWFGHDVGGSVGLFPVPQSLAAQRFLEHAYMMYYDEVFLTLFVLLFRRADMARFFSILFTCFLIGIPIFLIYPTIGPFTFAPETVLDVPDWRQRPTWTLMSHVLADWLALREGRELGGYGYFIAMPSLHVAVGLVLQVHLWCCRPAFWLMLPINVLLFLSTFLLGWHYVLDAPAGLAVGAAALGAARFWRSSSTDPERPASLPVS